MGEKTAITVTQNGQQVNFDEEHLGLIGGNVLTVDQIHCLADDDHGFRIDSTQESLILKPTVRCGWLDSTGREYPVRLANAGMLPIVRRIAARNGVEVRVANESLPVPLLEGKPGKGIQYPQLITFAQQHNRGIIESKQPAEVLAEMAAAFPGVLIVALSGKRRKLETTHRRLLQVFPEHQHDRIQLTHSKLSVRVRGDEPLTGIVLSTLDAASNFDFATANLVVFLDALESCHGKAKDPLFCVDASFRLFGIRDPRKKSSQYETANQMRVFGPEKISVHKGQVNRRVAVQWLPIRWTGKTDNSSPRAAQFFFNQVWRNQNRNQRIADVANQVSETPPSEGRSSANVAILVEHIQHAVELSELLPEWRVWAKGASGVRKVRRSFWTRMKQNERRWHTRQRHIVLTESAHSYQGAYDLDCVVWAGSTPSTQAIPSSWLFSKSDKLKPLVIVDFVDDFNKTTSGWSRKRKADYTRREIFSVGQDPVEGRIRSFLKSLKRQRNRK